MIYELYGKAHKTVKKLLGRTQIPQYRFVSVPSSELKDSQFPVTDGDNSVFFNEITITTGSIDGADIYPLENVVKTGSFSRLEDSYRLARKAHSLGVDHNAATSAWKNFITASLIPDGYRNAGLTYAGFILEVENWCLPSWIWTNAALVRMYCYCGQVEEARRIADILLAKQKTEGGWIVRYDYDSKGAIPIWAPNDSAYIANNACLEMYIVTAEEKYLEAAEHCARWIISSARPDGMVNVGYNMRESKWQKKHNIVDVGFTAGLFSRLYQITKNQDYKTFLDRFVERYTGLFYIKGKGFATSLDENDHILGGMFGRGQAWALEGLIPYFAVAQDTHTEEIINCTINTLLSSQTKDGGWPYNLTRKLMGIDCKATSIIAVSLYKWFELNPDRTDCLDAAKRALTWCEKHTANEGRCEGGIFSYSTEGAIVHNMYTSTAFTYACAYAIELSTMLKGNEQ